MANYTTDQTGVPCKCRLSLVTKGLRSKVLREEAQCLAVRRGAHRQNRGTRGRRSAGTVRKLRAAST